MSTRENFIDKKPAPSRILHIAVPTPLHRGFDYLANSNTPDTLNPGIRIKIPFGRKQVIGILLELRDHSTITASKLKPIISIIDKHPVLTPGLLKLGIWAAEYYHHPIGQVLDSMLPALLRQGHAEATHTEKIWSLSASGTKYDPAELNKAPKQQALLKHLQAYPAGIGVPQLEKTFTHWRAPIKALLDKGLLIQKTVAIETPKTQKALIPKPQLNTAQQQAVDTINKQAQAFQVWLLEGVTGSGKTEVYLRLIEQQLAEGRQVLVLVPEIGLTPQLIQRFQERFTTDTLAIHSAMSDRERLNTWISAKQGKARIIVGTRSAIFIPFASLGMIIVDEEHDGSLKQQEGFRYHARDLSVMRGHEQCIPVILGSATPSLESLQNALSKRYKHLQLPERAGNAKLPRLSVVDASQTPGGQPITHQLIARMRKHLEEGNQVLIFLNRRGFSPVLMCHDCGWTAECPRCDAHMTLHKYDKLLRCHHCEASSPIPTQCPECKNHELHPLGKGTEQLEMFLQYTFPEHRLLRIDRDATRRKGTLEKHLAEIHSGEAKILIGTQMLAKGHHFPGVTLVGVLGTDQGLFSADFRGPEYMAQLITQVAGRAGRANRGGEVIIETRHPEHPLLQLLIQSGYDAFARALLAERTEAQLPPFTRLALFRAESVKPDQALAFLRDLRDDIMQPQSSLEIMGPIPAPMERRAGRYRAQMLLQSQERHNLHRTVAKLIETCQKRPESRRVRWSVDIDPCDML